MEGINGKLESFGARIGTLASVAGIAGLVTLLASFAKRSFEAADAIGDAADRAGVAVETMSRLKYIAEQSDVEFGALTIGIKRWQVTLSQAATGSKDAANAIGLLKLNAEDLKGLSLEDQLATIADEFARIRDPADQTRVAVELFGRAGEQLVPLLKKGGGAVAELTAEANRLGITLDSTTTAAVDRADKALKRLFATISAAGQRTAGSFALAIIGPEGELEAASLKLDQLKKQRDELASAGPITKLLIPEGPRNRSIENLNRQIEQQQRLVNAIQRRAQQGAPDPLEIPKDPGAISEVTIKQRKAELDGLAKLLDQFERDTKTSEDKIYQDYLETTNKIKELQKQGIIDADEAARRIGDARIKYENDVLIDPVKITQSKVIVTQVLSEQQRAVDKFVDTLSVGLDNLAHSGELTGKSILKYLLSAFEAQALKDAISGLGTYLKKALGGTGGATSSGFGSFLAGIFGAFGHAAGGGRMSGPRIVGEDGPELDMGGGNILNRRQLAFAGGGGGDISIGPTTIVVQGTSDPATTAQYVEARISTNNRKLLEQVNRLMKDNYGRSLR